MTVVVADTGPLRYLVEIDQIGLLPQLFKKLFIPLLVFEELRHPSAPASVKAWTNFLPAWVEVSSLTVGEDSTMQSLHAGERMAISLALALGAGLILIDDRKGAAVALRKGFEVTGTLGLLIRASQRDLLDLTDAFSRPKRTNFHYRKDLFDELLKKYGRG